ncbi:carboxypeptidase-like regulatory domain-containing protein [Zhouia amylolytica]|uniref:TonB-dependent Receptor n=1 Tax=Zhouia amylolytica AD3 TaxID=1286632 RepID=W2UIL6_9FLAO|nr:carboxypeptidase-like regulatory domain-containing protein [Zhouia amylolytica]ETN93769.1 tonB-dependent Receptor [Zhouia amylolytica AD3]
MNIKVLIFRGSISCLFLLVGSPYINAQSVEGRLLDSRTFKPLTNVTVTVDNTSLKQESNLEGEFYLKGLNKGDHLLIFKRKNYLDLKYPITLSKDSTLIIGDLFMELNIIREYNNSVIVLSEEELTSDDFEVASTTGLLQASKDLYLNRAAFDFSQVFFKVRGYDSKEGVVQINGLSMNKVFNGRPQWNNWGGLNNVTGDQEFVMGLKNASSTFGGLLGSTNIVIRPSTFRKGLRITASGSNRTYAGRFMVTYNSGSQDNGLSYSISASKRLAREGFIDGTIYDAYSLFASAELKLSENHSLNVLGIYAPNIRGSSAPITKEVHDLLGKKYNPYWGVQDGDIRNSRLRSINEPFAILSHFMKAPNLSITTSVAYQFGFYAKGRLGYYNAPNPDPVYYRYLPSFYFNNPAGPNYENANIAKEGLLKNPQINWPSLYDANNSIYNEGKASYVQYDDRVDINKASFTSFANIEVSKHIGVDLGVAYYGSNSENYAIIGDLLGADFHKDIDPFTDTSNDLQGEAEKLEGERFNYNYEINSRLLNAFIQTRIRYNNLEAYLAGSYSNTHYQRNGLYLNERYEDNSMGKSMKASFADFALKMGVLYKFTGRHMLSVHGAYINRPPTLQSTFVNPREHNDLVSNLSSETVTTTDVSYLISLAKLKGRISGYYTKFEEVTDVNFFYYEGGVGNDFVQEVVADIDKLHFGGELALAYQASPSVRLSAVAGYGNYSYADNADVTINFDTSGREEDVIHPDGFLDLGITKIKDYKLAVGPQKVYSFGIEYRDPNYWWLSLTGNFLGDNYIDIATVTRTESFKINPESQEPFLDATEEAVAKLLRQEQLEDVYLLNLVGGKSWLYKGKYISLFASVNNLFDLEFRTGGFEQSRNGNFGQMKEDNARRMPSFGPKYWYGYGRTYFVNLSISF